MSGYEPIDPSATGYVTLSLEQQEYVEEIVQAAASSDQVAAQFLSYTSGYDTLDIQVLPVLLGQAQLVPEPDEDEDDGVGDAIRNLFETEEERVERVRQAIWDRIAHSPAPIDVALEGDALPGTARHDEYAGEDERMLWRAGTNQVKRESDDLTTQYEDRSTLEERSSDFDEEGRVLGADGQPVHGSWGWVVDAETGYLLLFDPNHYDLYGPNGEHEVGDLVSRPLRTIVPLLKAGWKVKTTHHTTPVAGASVGGAGTIELDRGYITSISDESGHYRPDAEFQYEAMAHLEEEGASFARPVYDEEGNVIGHREAEVTLTGADGGGRPTDKAGWIGELHDQNPDVPTGEVSLTVSQFAQTEGNETQIRLKEGLNAEFERTVAAGLRARAEEGAVESPDPQAVVPQGGDRGEEEGVGQGGSGGDKPYAPFRSVDDGEGGEGEGEELAYTSLPGEGDE